MPFVSQSQIRAAFAKGDPKWNAKQWLAETPNPSALPERVRPKGADEPKRARVYQRRKVSRV